MRERLAFTPVAAENKRYLGANLGELRGIEVRIVRSQNTLSDVHREMRHLDGEDGSGSYKPNGQGRPDVGTGSPACRLTVASSCPLLSRPQGNVKLVDRTAATAR